MREKKNLRKISLYGITSAKLTKNLIVVIIYIVYSDSAGWSEQIQFRTPPAGGSDELKFVAYGDMGKAPRDPSVEHYIQVGCICYCKTQHPRIYFENLVQIKVL